MKFGIFLSIERCEVCCAFFDNITKRKQKCLFSNKVSEVHKWKFFKV